MTEVKCTVSNCQFWSEQNVCQARQILIAAGRPEGMDKFGQNAQRLRQTPAAISEDTYCWTFISRDEDDALEQEERESQAHHGMMIPPLL